MALTSGRTLRTVQFADDCFAARSEHTDNSSQAAEPDPEVTRNYISSRRVPPRACRIASIITGLGVFLAVGFTVYYFVDKSEKPGQHPLFQGSVDLTTLQQHGTVHDCWVVYHGSVYDMTSYAGRHPGGPNRITPWCGVDGTTAYEGIHEKHLLNAIPETLLGVFTTDGSSTEDGGGDTPSSSTVVSQVALQQHNTPDDCWVVYHENVYSMTAYAAEHPGGSQRITSWCGLDGTDAFAAVHPMRYLNTIPDTLIGPYAGGSSGGVGDNGQGGTSITTTPRPSGTTFVETGNSDEESDSLSVSEDEDGED